MSNSLYATRYSAMALIGLKLNKIHKNCRLKFELINPRDDKSRTKETESSCFFDKNLIFTFDHGGEYIRPITIPDRR